MEKEYWVSYNWADYDHELGKVRARNKTEVRTILKNTYGNKTTINWIEEIKGGIK